MKHILNKRYFTYAALLSVILTIVMMSSHTSILFILIMLFPPALGWLFFLEWMRRQRLTMLQARINTLPLSEQRSLALSLRTSVVGLHSLTTLNLTHQQIISLQHYLSNKE